MSTFGRDRCIHSKSIASNETGPSPNRSGPLLAKVSGSPPAPLEKHPAPESLSSRLRMTKDDRAEGIQLAPTRKERNRNWERSSRWPRNRRGTNTRRQDPPCCHEHTNR